MKKDALKISKLISREIGREKVSIDEDILEKYSYDETSDLFNSPDILVRAESAIDVSKTLMICTQYKIPLTPRGAGSGVTGGAVPITGGVVLSLEKMNKIIEIDTENMVAVVEPGVITSSIQKAALQVGLMYPPDPASLDSCSIGGNVAEGAGGPKAIKYGTTKDYILGLEFVLPNGDIINTGGKFVKNVTGYNLIGLLTGSEGTLAVITRIILRLIPAPLKTVDLLIPFDSIEEALKTISQILHNKIIPSTLEFMEENAIKLVAKYLKEEMPFPDARAHLLVQIDGNSDEEINHYLEKLHDLPDISTKIIVAETNIQKKRIWKARRSIRDAIQNESKIFLSEDTVIPRSNILKFLKELKNILNSLNLYSIMFGHAGDGNVHTDILKGDMNYSEWEMMLPNLKNRIYKTAISFEGTITGEHGIGYLRKNFLPLALSNQEIAILKRIKSAFDPDLILNPKKIF